MSGSVANSTRWTRDEDSILLSMYAGHTISEIAQRIGRSPASTFAHSRRIGLLKRPPWTTQDDARLELAWGAPVSTIARELCRSESAVYHRAGFLGFAGIPKDGESITDASKRCGFTRSQLRRVLRWAGVDVHPVVPTGTRKRARRFWVDKVECDEAVARWVDSETPNAAAMRLGVSYPRLVRRLKSCGLNLPEKPTRKRSWRIPSALIDQAIAAQKAA